MLERLRYGHRSGLSLKVRLTLLAFLGPLLTGLVVAWGIGRRVSMEVAPLELDRRIQWAGRMATEFEVGLGDLQVDLRLLALAAPVQEWAAAAHRGERPSAEVEAQVTRICTAMASANDSYLQVRLLGAKDNWRELLRIERPAAGGPLRRVPEDQLQQKGDRPYVQAAARLLQGELYVSPIELNEEHGRVQEPPVRVVRVATTLVDGAGDPIGLLVTNVDVGRALDNLRAGSPALGENLLVDREGRYLVAPGQRGEFAAQRRSEANLKLDRPELTHLLNVEGPSAAILNLGDGDRVVAAVPVDLKGGVPMVFISLAPSLTEAASRAAWIDGLQKASLSALFAGLLALLIARSITAPLARMSHAAADAQGLDLQALPVERGDEIGILARALHQMAVGLRDRNTKMERQEQRFREVVETAPSAMVVADQNQVITLVNRNAELLFGYSRAELLGQRIELLVPKRFGSKHPDLVRSFQAEPKARAMGAGRELFGRRKDGSEVPIEIGLTPINTSEGPSTLAAIIDVTERRSAEARFRLVVEASPSALIMVDGRRSITLVNRRAEDLFGYPREELIGKPIELLVPERFREQHPQHMLGFFEAPKARAMGAGRDLYGRRKDGSEVPIEIGLNPIQTLDGLFTLASIIDITERKRAEERFRLVVEAAPSAMFAADAKGNITLVNRKAETLFGYDREELIGHPFQGLVPERFRAQHADHVQAFLKGPSARPMGAGRELFGLRKDGSEFPIEIGLNPIETPDGLVVMASIIDITERKRVEEAVRASDERFRLMVEGVTDYSILMLDEQGRVVSWNAGARRMKGYEAEEIIGKHFSVFHPPEDQASGKAQRDLEAASKLGRFEAEGWRVRKDGTRFWANVVLSAMRDPSGTIYGFSKMTRDLTQRRQAEERFELVVEASPTGLVMTDPNGRIVLVNAQIEKLFGYQRAELLGQPIEILVPERFRPPHADHRRGFLSQDGHRALKELHGLRRDGTEFPAEIGLSRIETSSGHGVMASVTDITQRKAYEDELRRSNAELEQFAYVASHDLQEPLRMVASFTELLGQRYKGQLDEKADKYIFFAVDGAKRMQRLVADLLTYSRVGSQGKPLLPVSAEAVLKHVLELLAGSIRTAEATVEVGPMPWVLADEGQLHQLFQNLVGNAIKFKGATPLTIKVSAERQGSDWLFAVADNGIGIDMQYAERIFQMFQRLHERGRYEGSGIGLAIAKRIVDRHGGRIWLDSKPGQGATFYFTLHTVPERLRS